MNDRKQSVGQCESAKLCEQRTAILEALAKLDATIAAVQIPEPAAQTKNEGGQRGTSANPNDQVTDNQPVKETI